jgi:hypothetical protein
MGRRGGRARAAALTPEQRSAQAAAAARAAAAALTPEQRAARARAAAQARWAGHTKPPPTPKRPRGRPRKNSSNPP